MIKFIISLPTGTQSDYASAVCVNRDAGDTGHLEIRVLLDEGQDVRGGCPICEYVWKQPTEHFKFV